MYFVHPWFTCHTPKLQKYDFLFFIYFYRGTMGKSRLLWFNPFENRSTQSAILGQNDQNAPSQPRVEWRSKLFKTTPKQHFSCFSHHTWGYQRFSSTLTKFDLKLTPNDDQKPNFDLTLRTSWNQHHCEEYWIPFPMTAHGSNVELKWLRYLENRTMHVNSLPEQWTKCTRITKNYPVWTKCTPGMEGMH